VKGSGEITPKKLLLFQIFKYDIRFISFPLAFRFVNFMSLYVILFVLCVPFHFAVDFDRGSQRSL